MKLQPLKGLGYCFLYRHKNTQEARRKACGDTRCVVARVAAGTTFTGGIVAVCAHRPARRASSKELLISNYPLKSIHSE
jgi:hypothetical protein